MLQEKFNRATRDILEKNMQVLDEVYKAFPVVVVYDLESRLSNYLSNWYKEALKGNNLSEFIHFTDENKHEVKQKLLGLQEWSTVILVQSTNFRIDDFRIRLILKQNWVGCLEHNHLSYITEDQIENYADSISYNTPYYLELSSYLKEKLEVSSRVLMQTKDGSKLIVEWWVEEVKTNTGDYVGKYRWGTFPIWEVFTEGRDFSKVNGTFTVYAYPDERFQVQFVEPFQVKITNSILSCDDPKCPEEFRKLLDKIELSEDGEVYVRELGFWMNTGISKQKRLSDVWAFERVSGFHISLGKKHNIYRKKFDKKIVQRYHIDIFPDVDYIQIDDEVVFTDGKYSI